MKSEILDRQHSPEVDGFVMGINDKMTRWLLLLCPPRKRKVRSPGVKARRATVKELDQLAREVVFARDGNKCRKCGRTERLQWCHVYSRRYRWLRWDTNNSFCGCAGCHLTWHHRPTEGAQWWESSIGQQNYSILRLMAGHPQKADPDKWKLFLLQEKKKYA